MTSVITDRLILLGSALIKFATGDFSGGIDGIKESFKGVGDGDVQGDWTSCRFSRTIRHP